MRRSTLLDIDDLLDAIAKALVAMMLVSGITLLASFAIVRPWGSLTAAVVFIVLAFLWGVVNLCRGYCNHLLFKGR